MVNCGKSLMTLWTCPLEPPNEETTIARMDGKRVSPAINSRDVLYDLDSIRISDAYVTIDIAGRDIGSIVQPSDVQWLGFEPNIPNHAANGRLPKPNGAIARGRAKRPSARRPEQAM